jgi:hypothetical protein
MLMCHASVVEVLILVAASKFEQQVKMKLFHNPENQQ